jgi:hypothetical protein
MTAKNKSAYSYPDDFMEETIYVIQKKNVNLSVALGKHIEFCFFTETDYVNAVKAILADIDNAPLKTILEKLDAAYQKALVDQGFDKPGVTYN